MCFILRCLENKDPLRPQRSAEDPLRPKTWKQRPLIFCGGPKLRPESWALASRIEATLAWVSGFSFSRGRRRKQPATLHKFCVHHRWQRRLFLISFEFPRIFAQFASTIFTQGMESVSPQCRCLLKLLTKRFLMFCVKNLSFLWKNCVSWDSEDGKRTVCKIWARKIVNCYRMFAELREALAGCRALDKAKTYSFKRSRPQTPSTACSSSSIPVRG